MTLEHTLARWFRMSDEVWARHANPWSVWTRYPCLPLLALAVWSRVWIGGWALVPVGLTVLWIWLNPRVFAKPKTTDNWASKGVLGERVWLNRTAVPVPAHHHRIILVLNVLAGIGAVVCVYGLVFLRADEVVIGIALTLLAKSWFLDRMVWIYDEVSPANAAYREWLY